MKFEDFLNTKLTGNDEKTPTRAQHAQLKMRR